MYSPEGVGSVDLLQPAPEAASARAANAAHIEVYRKVQRVRGAAARGKGRRGARDLLLEVRMARRRGNVETLQRSRASRDPYEVRCHGHSPLSEANTIHAGR